MGGVIIAHDEDDSEMHTPSFGGIDSAHVNGLCTGIVLELESVWVKGSLFFDTLHRVFHS